MQHLGSVSEKFPTGACQGHATDLANMAREGSGHWDWKGPAALAKWLCLLPTLKTSLENYIPQNNMLTYSDQNIPHHCKKKRKWMNWNMSLVVTGTGIDIWNEVREWLVARANRASAWASAWASAFIKWTYFFPREWVDLHAKLNLHELCVQASN